MVSRTKRYLWAIHNGSRSKKYMTTYEYTQDETQSRVRPQVVPVSKGRIVVNWLTSTDHKTIGYMYLISSFTFFGLAGVMALLIRAELFSPGMQVLQTKEQFNQLFTMHGTMMLLMFEIGRASCREGG